MPNGILVIDKPADWTSMDVCAKVRGIFHEKRVGHAGTLDPMATGVLPVFIGRATRAVEFASESEKEYIAELKLGVITNTQDTTGEVVEERPVTVGRDEVLAVLDQFRGDITQIPPMYSAIKIGGQKLYELARKGQEVARKPRHITIYELELLAQEGEADYLLRCRCSKGTYIRTLLEDIAAAMGQKGTMSALRRTQAGVYGEADAHTLEEILAAKAEGRLEELLLPVESVFESLPLLTVALRVEQHLYNGCPTSRYPAADGRYRVRNEAGQFLGLAWVVQGVLRVEKLFVERSAG